MECVGSKAFVAALVSIAALVFFTSTALRLSPQPPPCKHDPTAAPTAAAAHQDAATTTTSPTGAAAQPSGTPAPQPTPQPPLLPLQHKQYAGRPADVPVAQGSRYQGTCMPPLPNDASFSFGKPAGTGAEVVFGPTRRTGALEPIDLPNVKTMHFFGNSVTRHWFAVAEQLWQEKQGVVRGGDCDGGYRQLEQTRCSKLGASCRTDVAGLRLSFSWQQSMYDTQFELLLFDLLREHPGGSGLVVVLNMGLDFLADSATRPRWESFTQRLAPVMARLLGEFMQAAPYATLVWKTSTALCGEMWGLQPEDSNAMLEYSNGVTVAELRRVQSEVYANIEAWREAYRNRSGSAPPALVPREPMVLVDMFGATACACEFYEDKVHHCLLGKNHVYTLFEVLSRHVL